MEEVGENGEGGQTRIRGKVKFRGKFRGEFSAKVSGLQCGGFICKFSLHTVQ